MASHAPYSSAEPQLLDHTHTNQFPVISPHDAEPFTEEVVSDIKNKIGGQQTTLSAAIATNLQELYDKQGRLISEFDEKGIKTLYHYGTGANRFKLLRLTFVLPKGIVLPSGEVLARRRGIQIKISDYQMTPDAVHSGSLKAAFFDLISKGTKVLGLTWKLVSTRAQHQSGTPGSCMSSAASFQCDFRLEGGKNFFEYRVKTNIQAPSAGRYTVQTLDSGLIANAPLTSQTFRRGRLVKDLDEVGIKTRYFYSKTGGLEKLHLDIPRGTLLPNGIILAKNQSISISFDSLFFAANPIHMGLIKSMLLDVLAQGQSLDGKWTLRPSHISRQASLASTSCIASASSFGCSFRLEKIKGKSPYFEYTVQAVINTQGKASYTATRLGSGNVIFDMKFHRYNFSLPFTPGRGFIVQTDEFGRLFLIVEREGLLFRGPFQLAPLVKGRPRPWQRQGRNFIVRLANGSSMIFDVNDGSVFTTLFPG